MYRGSGALFKMAIPRLWGRFYMKFKTVGSSGTYPVYSTSRTPDTLRVDYDY